MSCAACGVVRSYFASNVEMLHTFVPRHLAVAHGYMINVASAQRGVGYGRWVHIDGFSEAVLRFVNEYEQQE